jgi:hypothetical protein
MSSCGGKGHTHWARIIKDIHVPVEGSKLCLVWAERRHPPPQLSLGSLALSTYLSILIGWSLTLSCSSKLNGYLYHQRVSPLNALICFQRAMLPLQMDLSALCR